MTVDTSGPNTPTQRHTLQCMELWSGNRSVENVMSSSGLEIWIHSRTYHGDARGGDVHYLSLCVGGIVTRLLLADVAGHGDEVASTSQQLRRLLRRFMNAKDQKKLVAELNQEFTQLEQSGRFATAVVATYQSNKRRLILTNAGHPRPLFFRKRTGQWKFLETETESDTQLSDLPLGLDNSSSYSQMSFSVEPGDLLVLYTDAFVEEFDSKEVQLGEAGFREAVAGTLFSNDVESWGREVLLRLSQRSGKTSWEDDATFIAISFVANRRRPGILEKLRAYGEVAKSIWT